jgi:hypothetical protein
VQADIYREVKVYINPKSKKLIVSSAKTNSIAQTLTDYERSEIDIHLLLATQRESCRVYQGILVGGTNPLVYQVE